jgi:ankyrin repeat protein
MALLTPNKLRVMIAIEECKSPQGLSLVDVFEGLDLEQKLEEGLTFLMIAGSNANFQVVKFLIQNGVRTDSKTNQGYTALYLSNHMYEKTNDIKYVSIIRLLDNLQT